jgi:hypothetical protein
MLYVDFNAGGKDYKLRLDTRSTITLEKQLGCNPLAIFGNGDEMPQITKLVQVLYCSMLPLNHGITLEATYDIFDQYLADGHTATDFLMTVVEIYKASGLIANEKN